MIEATDIVAKVGKKKFVEMASQSMRGERMLEREKRKRWGKNVKSRLCEHGTWTIYNYKKQDCKRCSPISTFFIPKDVDYQGFNIGLGGITESRSDFKRACKEKGLTHIGDDRL